MKPPAPTQPPAIDENLPPSAWGGLLGDSLRRLLRSKPAVLSLVVIGIFLIAGIFAPLLAPYNPYQMGWGHDGLPPAWVHSGVKVGEPQHPLGTDSVGRDVLSRLLYGTRTALSMALPGAAIAALLGTLVGLAAGFFSGRIDRLLMQVSDIFNAFPTIMFSVLLVLIFRRTPFGNWQNGLLTVALSFALVAWAPLARLARAAVLKVRQELYVEAALSVGIPSGRLLFRHILPNISSIIIVWLTTAIPRVIILEALLGYIGIRITAAAGDGAESYVVSWGGMFFDGRATLRSNPTLLIAPSVCVILVAVAFTLLGDRLRDAMDTRLRDLM